MASTVRSNLRIVEGRACLEVLAITEHDDLETALRAREAWARRREHSISSPASEITTLDGHVIALFIERAGGEPAPGRGDAGGGARPGRPLYRPSP